jgi:hypothetical protein
VLRHPMRKVKIPACAGMTEREDGVRHQALSTRHPKKALTLTLSRGRGSSGTNHKALSTRKVQGMLAIMPFMGRGGKGFENRLCGRGIFYYVSGHAYASTPDIGTHPCSLSDFFLDQGGGARIIFDGSQ